MHRGWTFAAGHYTCQSCHYLLLFLGDEYLGMNTFMPEGLPYSRNVERDLRFPFDASNNHPYTQDIHKIMYSAFRVKVHTNNLKSLTTSICSATILKSETKLSIMLSSSKYHLTLLYIRLRIPVVNYHYARKMILFAPRYFHQGASNLLSSIAPPLSLAPNSPPIFLLILLFLPPRDL